MSATTATLISGIVAAIAGIAGVLIGLFADRLLQRQGKVRCVMEPIEVLVFSEGVEQPTTLRSLPIPAELLPESMPGRQRKGQRTQAKLVGAS